MHGSSVAQGVQPKIIGGKPVLNRILPWQTYMTISWNDNVFRCGGTLIAPKWVLTAAHCVYENGPINTADLSVWVGILARSEAQSQNRSTVKAIYIHPQFESSNLRNDIALIELNEAHNGYLSILSDSEFPSFTQNLATNWIINHASLQVSGWGLTKAGDPQSLPNQLQQTVLLGVPLVTCLEQWQTGNIDLSDHQIVCASSPHGLPSGAERDSCGGDSGGPLIWQDTTQKSQADLGLRLVGVISFGMTCGDPNVAGVYSSTHAYRGWIEQTTNLVLSQLPTSTFGADPFVVFEQDPNENDKGGHLGVFSMALLLWWAWRRHRFNR